MNLHAAPVKVADGFKFCEGPAFGPDGKLYVVNVQGGFVSKVSVDGEHRRFVDTGGTPNGGNFDADGNYLVCDCRLRAVIRVAPDGQITTLVDACEHVPFQGPNDLAVDADGGFYFTDPHNSSLKKPIGAVYYARPDRTVVRVDGGLAYPNGIVINANRSEVIVAETATRRLLRYERREDGTLSERATFCRLEGGVGPDGCCFDIESNLYVAHYGSGCMAVIDPAGRLVGTLGTPGKNPTNCCFGPPGSQFASSLFVTESRQNIVWRYDVGVPGMPLLHLAVAGDQMSPRELA